MLLSHFAITRPRGPTDKASDYGSEDSGFKSLRGYSLFLPFFWSKITFWCRVFARRLSFRRSWSVFVFFSNLHLQTATQTRVHIHSITCSTMGQLESSVRHPSEIDPEARRAVLDGDVTVEGIARKIKAGGIVASICKYEISTK